MIHNPARQIAIESHEQLVLYQVCEADFVARLRCSPRARVRSVLET